MNDRQHQLRQTGTFGSTYSLPMSPCPIDPAWLRSGTPTTRCDEHSSTVDGFAWTMVWDCTRSKFEWHYTVDEFVVILEGSVHVTDSSGRSHMLRAGDVGYFPADTTWFWEVDNYVRKVAFCRDEVPRSLWLPMRIVRRIKREVRDGNRPITRMCRRLAAALHRFSRIGRTTATVMLMGIPL